MFAKVKVIALVLGRDTRETPPPPPLPLSPRLYARDILALPPTKKGLIQPPRTPRKIKLTALPKTRFIYIYTLSPKTLH